MTIGPTEKRYLAAQLASQRQINEQVHISEVRALTGGWETDIYQVTAGLLKSGRTVHEDFVVRLYAGGHGSVRAAREFHVLTRAGRAGLPVPVVELLGPSSSGLGNPFVVMESVQGTTLAQVLEEQGSEVTDWLDEMVRLLDSVHRVKPSDVLEGLPKAPGVIPPDLGDMRRAVEHHRLASGDAIIRWLEKNLAPRAAESLLHGDFHPGNIIVRDDELVLIDWSFAEKGDHRLDLAWTALLSPSYRSWLLDDYALVSGRTVEYFDYFEALKLGARLMTLAAWLDGSLEIPVEKITPDAIRGDYRVHVLNVYRRWKEVTGERITLFETL